MRRRKRSWRKFSRKGKVRGKDLIHWGELGVGILLAKVPVISANPAGRLVTGGTTLSVKITVAPPKRRIK